ncbi:MAG TPA: MmcB family DNA repair protein [Planctomycetota bacterium]|nr:MmcB family DNA repair protein [Planctomycetota bacterium]
MKCKTEKPKAQDLLSLLGRRHAKDLFVPECKSGPTWGGSHFRLDAWAMRRSWVNFCTFGYEIKVSRSDFIRDEKWRFYLAYCHELFFCTPKGLVKPDELPPEVGLIEATSNGRRLVLKKRAAHRQLQIPEELFCYILMCRAKIIERQDGYSERPDREWWEEWMKMRIEERRFGKIVGKAIRQTIDQRIRAAEDRNEELARENRDLSEVREQIRQLFPAGFNPSSYQITDRLEQLGLLGPMQRLEGTLERLEDQIAHTKRAIATAKGKLNKDDD